MPLPPTLLEIPKDPLLAAFDQLPDDQHLTTKQVASLLQVSTSWLEAQRAMGKLPPWVALGSHLTRYAVGPLRKWLQARRDNTPASTYAWTRQEKERIIGLNDETVRRGQRRWMKK